MALSQYFEEELRTNPFDKDKIRMTPTKKNSTLQTIGKVGQFALPVASAVSAFIPVVGPALSVGFGVASGALSAGIAAKNKDAAGVVSGLASSVGGIGGAVSKLGTTAVGGINGAIKGGIPNKVIDGMSVQPLSQPNFASKEVISKVLETPVNPDVHTPFLDKVKNFAGDVKGWANAEKENVGWETDEKGNAILTNGKPTPNRVDLMNQTLTSDYRKGLIATGIQALGRTGSILGSLNQERNNHLPSANTASEIQLQDPTGAISAANRDRENEVTASGLYAARENGYSPESVIANSFKNSQESARNMSTLVSQLVNQQNTLNANIRTGNADMLNKRDADKFNMRQSELDRKEELNSLLLTNLADVAPSMMNSKVSLDLAKYKTFFNK